MSVAVCALVPVMSSDAGMAQVTGLVGFVGVVVTEQLRFTTPVNPPVGETVMVEVLPVVAPPVTAMSPLLVAEIPEMTLLMTTLMAAVWM